MRRSFKLLGYRNWSWEPQFSPIFEASSPLMSRDSFHLYQRFFKPRKFSAPTVELTHHTLISNAFSANYDTAAIDTIFQQNGLALDRKLVVGTLKSLYTNPEAAFKFFNWVSSKDSQRMSSKEYNLMLRILGSNGLASEFWNLASIMKDLGYGISTGDKRVKASDTDSIESLLKSGENAGERSSKKVSMLIRSRNWGEELEEEIRGMGLELSSEYLKSVIENLAMEPMKALIFFRWTEEMVKHDSITYNAIARVIVRRDCLDGFWKLLSEMKTNAYKMELRTYIKAADYFLKNKLNKEAVDVVEHAIASQINLPPCTFTLLLKNISSAKDFDPELFGRVVNMMKENGILISKSMLSSVVKSLTSVKQLSECSKIVKIVKDGGLIIDGGIQREIAYYLSKHCEGETEAFVEAIEGELDGKAIVEGYCDAGKLREAREIYRVLLGRMEGEKGRDAFHCLMEAHCRKKGMRGLELTKEETEVKPWRKSYVALIDRLVKEGAYEAAVEVVGMMRENGYEPLIGPLIEHLKRVGTVDDAVALMDATASSRKIGLEIFREFAKGGKHEEARGFFRKCRASFRTHPEVLIMLAEMKKAE